MLLLDLLVIIIIIISVVYHVPCKLTCCISEEVRPKVPRDMQDQIPIKNWWRAEEVRHACTNHYNFNLSLISWHVNYAESAESVV